jgi:NADPH:quinone reductase-like Zn-dependent oxidoreductase
LGNISNAFTPPIIIYPPIIKKRPFHRNRMSTHQAIASVAVRAPLEIIQVPTVQPVGLEVRVRVEWVASTPLDLHQNDGGLLFDYPQILGDGLAGRVEEVGPMVRNLAVGDQVR